MFTYLTRCRACGSDQLATVFSLGTQPLANAFRSKAEEQPGSAPLEVMVCERCTLAQLSVVVKPEILYSNYPYTTSRSATMLDHFKLLLDSIESECPIESVVEIGSNDGHFLRFCKERGAGAVMGIDPAENLKPSGDAGITSLCGLFDPQTATIAKAAMPPVNVVVARHVFAHIDDWTGFVKSLDVLATQDTLIVIECPYVVDLLNGVELDTVYHEHLSYVSLKAVKELLTQSVFHLHKVQKFDIHGGAIAIMLRRNDNGRLVDPSVNDFLARESITLESWKNFADSACDRISNLKIEVNVHCADKKVIGYGASAKSTVWINACGFTRDDIAFIVDSTPQKQGKFSPGTDIPIVPESELTNVTADMAICFAWNFMDEIIKKNKAWIDGGGTFINPHSL